MCPDCITGQVHGSDDDQDFAPDSQLTPSDDAGDYAGEGDEGDCNGNDHDDEEDDTELLKMIDES